jgi:Flp pilus assembly protein TadD
MVKHWSVLAAIVFALATPAFSQDASPKSGTESEECRGPVEDSHTTVTEARKLARQNQARRAVDLLNRHLKGAPNDEEARVALASTLNNLGRRKEAREAVEQTLKAEPDNVDALLVRGIINLREDNLDAAEADFRTVISQAPRYCDAYVFLGQILLRKGDVTSAKTLMDSTDKCCADNADLTAVRKRIERRSRATGSR